MCESVELVLDCRFESVADGRHLLGVVLDRWGVAAPVPTSELRGDVLLVASELLANAARACRDRIVLTVEAHRDHIRLDVRDDSPARAVPRPSSPEQLTGRGLAIVAALSTEWGQSPYDGATKKVWSDIGLPTGSTLAVECRL